MQGLHEDETAFASLQAPHRFVLAIMFKRSITTDGAFKIS